MRITKFGHSCVLVEESDKVALFDPGNYSWESGSFDIAKLDKLDKIFITHEHQDHMHMPFIKALVEKFPDVWMVTTEPAVKILREAGFNNVTSESNADVTFFHADHEPMAPLAPTIAANVGMHYLGLFTDPGDAHHFPESKAVLALPITAPWGTTARAAGLIKELHPKYVLPVHDWLWRDEIRQAFYPRLESFAQQFGVTFLSPTDGVPVEVDV